MLPLRAHKRRMGFHSSYTVSFMPTYSMVINVKCASPLFFLHNCFSQSYFIAEPMGVEDAGVMDELNGGGDWKPQIYDISPLLICPLSIETF